MTRLPCADVRRHLEAYHDGELRVPEQVAVSGHVQECAACAAELRSLEEVGQFLRRGAAERVSPPADTRQLATAVISRVQAEAAAAWPAQVGRMFEDMHLVWAGLSATVATVACAVLLFSIWFLSPPEREDSLSGILAALSAPGSDRNPVTVDHRMRLPRATDDVVPALLAKENTEEELVFALAAVVTQEGRVARSEVLLSNQNREVVLRLMNAVNEARFKPASLEGSPVAVNFVWLLTHTTVRGKTHS
jgi:hypothetical protein